MRYTKLSLSQKIINFIEMKRDKKKKNQPGEVGRFWRDGGYELIYDLPVTNDGLIVDAGGYKGEWSAGMISRYGCRIQIFEPVPEFFEYCQAYFRSNKLVQVNKSALGGSDRKTRLNLLDNSTSEYKGNDNDQKIDSDVIDVAKVFGENDLRVACFKLNIEGAEYEVLERMIETNKIILCDSLLIQFHRQPNDYEPRYRNIVSELRKTHTRSWCYEMVWEKWVRKSSDE